MNNLATEHANNILKESLLNSTTHTSKET